MYKHICVQRLLVVRDGTHISCPMHAHSVSTIIRLSTYITPKRICLIAQALQHCNVPQANLVSPSKSALSFQGGSIRFLDLVSEESVETLHQSFRWAAFYNLPYLGRQSDGHELLQGGHAAQDDIANKPLYVML